ncbi:MAG: serine hydrolase [Chloroflexi bacterium]|nr:serine hydrolase [Chloroflexota bacterium]
MRRRGPDLLRWFSLALLLIAIGLTFLELVAFSRQRARLPRGLMIAGVSVGGLDRTEASERLLQVYGSPVELHYADQVFWLSPAAAGFSADVEAMLAAAELVRTGGSFWTEFWDYLWNRPGEVDEIPLRADISAAQMEAALRDIAARYDQPPTAVQPIPGTSNFRPGQPGEVLDISRAAELLGAVLRQPSNRRLNLPVVEGDAPRASLSTLATLLKQNIDVAGFDGLAVLYMQDLRSGDELLLGRYRNAEFQLEPDIAFTAASTIKIPIMIAFYRAFDEPLDDEAGRWLREMITESGNDPADWLMERIDPVYGPIRVTETIRELGFENTFMAGYFYLDAPLLRDYLTPANHRPDLSTAPDRYNQTTASEIGMLLADLYECGQGGGALLAAFPGEITVVECQTMLDLLAQNQIGVLIEAGVPDGTRVAHKHGWTDSPLTWAADAGIVYSPAGDYVLTMYLWNDREMIWVPTSALMADLSRSVYNYFNPPSS